MTEEQRAIALEVMAECCNAAIISPAERQLITMYHQEHERMRQFIRNLADESRVYLESEE